MILNQNFQVIRVTLFTLIFTFLFAFVLIKNEQCLLDIINDLPLKYQKQAYGKKMARIFTRLKEFRALEKTDEPFVVVFGGSTSDQNIWRFEKSASEIVGQPVVNLSMHSETLPEIIRILDSVKSEKVSVVFSYYPWFFLNDPYPKMSIHKNSYGRERPHLLKSETLPPLMKQLNIQNRKIVVFPLLSPHAIFIRLSFQYYWKKLLVKIGLKKSKKKRKAPPFDAKKHLANMKKNVVDTYQVNIERNKVLFEAILDLAEKKNINFTSIALPYNEVTYQIMGSMWDQSHAHFSELMKNRGKVFYSHEKFPFTGPADHFIDHGHYSKKGAQHFRPIIFESYRKAIESI